MVRFTIALLVIASFVFGWIAYQQQQRLTEVRAALAPGGKVATTVASIQRNAELYTLYKDRGASDALHKGGDDAGSYIREIAAHPLVLIGRVDINPQREQEIGRDVVERSYRIEPNDRRATFSRRHIANFLYKLEEDSQRVKVTFVDLKTPTRVGDGERPVDLWQLTTNISMRSKRGR